MAVSTLVDCSLLSKSVVLLVVVLGTNVVYSTSEPSVSSVDLAEVLSGVENTTVVLATTVVTSISPDSSPSPDSSADSWSSGMSVGAVRGKKVEVATLVAWGMVLESRLSDEVVWEVLNRL